MMQEFLADVKRQYALDGICPCCGQSISGNSPGKSPDIGDSSGGASCQQVKKVNQNQLKSTNQPELVEVVQVGAEQIDEIVR